MTDLKIRLPENLMPVFQHALADLAAGDIPARIWSGDFRVWANDPAEISNRLGWLDIANRMQFEVADLTAFADEIMELGLQDAVLMGMGGSSLAPYVFSQTFPPSDRGLRVRVLDSTEPAAIQALMQSVDPEQTLFLVSTKSGTTTETLSFFKYTFNRVAEHVGAEAAGQHFAAITDPGSPLVELARSHGFRRIFANDPNIGGRYSALSYVGMVPAALLGMDVEKLLGGAVAMADGCGADVAADANPAVRLGAAIGELAKQGRDKLTLVASPTMRHFGDWVEQLIAESTGKSGTGILPVVGEPLGAPGVYGPDRVFAVLRTEDEAVDKDALAALQAAGHPLIEIVVPGSYSMGGQMFLWELATAVAGQRLGIQPFNQPNVEAAKEQARKMTDAYRREGELPSEVPLVHEGELSYFAGSPGPAGQETAPASLSRALLDLLNRAQAGSYLALQAYLPPSEEADGALRALRLALRDRTRMAVTVGYGPRYLHSTGQLHKGDAGRGLFLQFTCRHPTDLPIPDQAGEDGSSISFGTLIDAQAMGDRQALADAGRVVGMLDLGSDFLPGLRQVRSWVE
jgi:glucose-6-phosphate isomerase